MSVSERNRKVAKSRGKKWRENIIAGRHAASMAPSALRMWRIKSSMSQYLVAKKLGLSGPTYAAIELGKRMISEERARKMVTVSGKSMALLFKKVADDKYTVKKEAR